MAGRIAARLMFVSLALAAATVTALGAQQVFRSSTDLVLLSVTATSGTQHARGLTRDDFRVLEDGRIQDIGVFERDPRPVALSILMDASTSMEPILGIAQDAAIAFCRRLGPGDIAQFMTFNETTDVRQRFTADVELLEKAIRETRLSSQTALYIAIDVALHELQSIKNDTDGLPRRKALVLVSDGEDNVSRLSYTEVVERAKRSDVTVFAIALRPGRGRDGQAERYSESNFALRSITQVTGGRVFFVERAAEMPAVYEQIADELANQYTIGYVSKNAAKDGAWRLVSVRIARPGAVARTREGYYAPGQSRVR